MFFRPQTKRRTRHSRTSTGVIVAALTLGSLAILPAPGLASNSITVAAGGTAIEVNGTTISTSNLTLSQLAELQGIPGATVKLELEGVAAGTPVTAAVDELVRSLPLQTTLASALDRLSGASGGLITPPLALERIIEDHGQPGASGSAGTPGANGAGASSTSAGTTNAAGPTKNAFTLRLASRSLKGHPRSRVRLMFTVSSAAKISFGGRGLVSGSRKVGSGRSALIVVLPARHGNYRLALKAVSTTGGQTAQASAVLHDAQLKAPRGRRH